MTLEVIWGSGSPFAWRVLLTLEVKGLGYEFAADPVLARRAALARASGAQPSRQGAGSARRRLRAVGIPGDHGLSRPQASRAAALRPLCGGDGADLEGDLRVRQLHVPARPPDRRACVRGRAARRGGRAGGGGGAAWRARPHGAGGVGTWLARRGAAQRRRPRGLSVRRGAAARRRQGGRPPDGIGPSATGRALPGARGLAPARHRPCPATRAPIRRTGAKRPEAGWSPRCPWHKSCHAARYCRLALQRPSLRPAWRVRGPHSQIPPSRPSPITRRRALSTI